MVGLVPQPGIEPVSPRWKADSSPLDHQGSPHLTVFDESLYVPCGMSGTEQYIPILQKFIVLFERQI